MAGFLDSFAPSIAAEYTRYIEGDALGKILFKNFLRHRIGVTDEQIYVPRGRHGDVEADRVIKAGAQVSLNQSWKDIEIKCARINKANRYRGADKEDWAFTSLLTTGRNKEPKNYDIAVAIVVRVLGHEESAYWDYLQLRADALRKQQIEFGIDCLPHEDTYLNLCGFFVIPYSQIETDYFRVHFTALSHCRYHRFFAWGHNPDRCRQIWLSAIEFITQTREEQDMQ